MGKRIKATGVILDASSMASAPVSPAGTVALRAKPDSTQLQYSANGGAWTDLAGGAGSSVRLDQVLDPIDPIVTPYPGVKAFGMGSNQISFSFLGADHEDCMVFQSTTDAPGSGSVLLLRTLGASTTKSPLRIEGRGAFYFSVGVDGKVAIGGEAGLVHKLNVYHTNTGGASVGILHAATTLAAGNTAIAMSNAEIRLDDTGNTTALLAMTNLELDLDRDSSSVANSSLVCTNISASSNINANTLTVRNLALSIGVHNSATVTNWEAIRITAPSTFGGGVLTNKRAIITEAGAGDVGFGTLTPAAQLHVSGTVQVDQTTTQAITLYKYTDTTDPFTIDIKRAHGTSSGTAANIVTGDIVGRMLFEGRLAGTYTQLGYLQTRYDSTYIGVVELGAGASFSQSRVEVVETGSVGAVSLRANGGNYFQVQTSGFIFSHGSTGSLYFRDGGGWFTATAAPPAADRIAFWDNSAGVVTWLEAGSGLTITGTVMTASGSGITLGGNVLEVLYKSGTSSIGSIAVAGTTTYLKSNGAGVVPSFQTINASDIASGTLALARGGTGASLTAPVSDHLFFYDISASSTAFLTLGTGLSITGTTINAAGGPANPSGSLQYNDGGVFGDVLGSVVDGSGNLTFPGTMTWTGGSTIAKSDSSVIHSLRVYTSTPSNGAQISVLRSRGSEGSKSAVQSGDVLFAMPIYGQYDSVGQRLGASLGFDASGVFSTSSAPTVFRIKTSHVNSTTPNERLVLGGSKTLYTSADNTLVDLFSVTFAAADQAVVGGEIHMLITAKQVSGSIQTQVYHRKMHFVFGHNGATNSSAVDIRLDSGVGSNQVASSGGFSQLQHAINSSSVVDMTTAITLGTLGDVTDLQSSVQQ